jgi:hypothetical protein
MNSAGSTCKALALCLLSSALIAFVAGCGSESVGPDTTAPAAIASLWVQATGCDDVSLAWSAPGDDGSEGTASSYDVRYFGVAITEDNWPLANECDGEPTPQAAGLTEHLTVSGLASGTTYHFACKARDDAGNESDLSNDVSSTVGSTAIAWVNDGAAEDEDWDNSTTHLSTNWAVAACADGYEYTLGTTQGGTDVIGWTSGGTQTSVTRTGLTLTEGQTYYWSVRSVLGIVPATPTSSDGITVDITLPTSEIDPLPAEEATQVFTVTWSGNDAGSGIKDYDVQISSDGGGSWGTWLTATPLSSAACTGLNGSTYHFRCRARDNAGNTEAYPAEPDAHTTVNLATGLQVDWVHDGLGDDAAWTNSTATLSANWPAASGAGAYEYAIGTAPGGSEIRGWASAGTATSVTQGGLSLVPGYTYYLSVRVKVGVGHGVAVSSDGITVDTGAPSSTVGSLAATTSTLLFTVAWSGSDALSGLSQYDVQVKDGTGSWTDLLTATTLTEYDFTGELDHTYYFRSRAYDVAGNVEDYLTDPDTWTCVTCSYFYSRDWGQEGTGEGDFKYPFNIAVDALGNVYVADSENARVQVFDPYGNFLRKLGGYGNADSLMWQAAGVAIDDSGYVYVTDFNADKVKKYTSDGAFVTTWGGSGTGDDQMDYPRGISVDDSFYVYVAEQGNERVHKFTSKGVSVKIWGANGTADGLFRGLLSVAVAPSGDIYAVDSYNNRIQQFTSNGTFVRKWGSIGTVDGKFSGLNVIAVDASGCVYVTDGGNCRVQKFTPEGGFLTKWGSLGTADGQFLDEPLGIAVHTDGTVYVTDIGAYRVIKFLPTCP